MRIYFGTNRNPNNQVKPTDFGIHFSPNGLSDLRFGWADVNENNLDEYELTVAEESLNIDMDKASVSDFKGQILGSQTVFEEVRSEMSLNKQDCVIYTPLKMDLYKN